MVSLPYDLLQAQSQQNQYEQRIKALLKKIIKMSNKREKGEVTNIR